MKLLRHLFICCLLGSLSLSIMAWTGNITNNMDTTYQCDLSPAYPGKISICPGATGTLSIGFAMGLNCGKPGTSLKGGDEECQYTQPTLTCRNFSIEQNKAKKEGVCTIKCTY